MALQQKRIEALEEQLARSKRTSANSSKPPSSDIVKPPKETKRRKKKRKIGGQPGHPKHERDLCADDADIKHRHELDFCPGCGGESILLVPEASKWRFQFELVEKPIVLHAHEAFAYWCDDCEEVHHAQFPVALRKSGLVGPRLSSLVGSLKGGCHASYSTIRSLLSDALGVTLSRGMLAKVIQKVSAALEPSYCEALSRLPAESRLNIDETGHKENGSKHWTWVFCAKDFAVFSIDPSRGSQVLDRVLGPDCEAVLGHDYFSSYRAYMKNASVTVQFCLAHVIREARFLAESNRGAVSNYGTRVLNGLRRMFKMIHQRQKIPPDRFRRRLERARDKFLAMAKRTQAGGEAANLAKRFRVHGKVYFTFITEPDIEPTNNVAEQALRFCVIDRRITQGTRGVNGRRWCERIWTTMATCTQQGRPVFDFLHEAISALFHGTPVPSLALDTT